MRDHKRSERRVAGRERILRALHEAETAAKGVQVREAQERRTGMHAKCRSEIAAGKHGCTTCCWEADHSCEGARIFDAWVSEEA